MAQGKTLERSERLSIRVTPEEKIMLLDKAAKAGLTITGFVLWETLGEQLGQCILDGFEKSSKASNRKKAPTTASRKKPTR